MEFREVLRWLPDNAPLSTEAIVVVSRCGNVIKRLPYKLWNIQNQNYSERKEYIYKPSNNRGKQRKEVGNNKYLHICANNRTYSVHRLVALAWIPNPLNKPQVNHINGIKNDNRVENLEWVTNLENRQHADNLGLPRKSIEKINNKQVAQARKLLLSGLKLSEVGKKFGVTGECIRYRVAKILTPTEAAIIRKRIGFAWKK